MADFRHDGAVGVLHSDMVCLYGYDRLGPWFAGRLDKDVSPCLLRILEISESTSQTVQVLPNRFLNDHLFLLHPVDFDLRPSDHGRIHDANDSKVVYARVNQRSLCIGGAGFRDKDHWRRGKRSSHGGRTLDKSSPGDGFHDRSFLVTFLFNPPSPQPSPTEGEGVFGINFWYKCHPWIPARVSLRGTWPG